MKSLSLGASITIYLGVSASAVPITALELTDCLIPYRPSPFFVVENLGVKTLMKIDKKYFGRDRNFGSIN
jgi:hypothetical protein